MGLQQIFDKDPAQQFLDKLAFNESRLFLAALKAATALANEVNASEAPPELPPEELEAEKTKAKEENGGAEPPAEPLEQEGQEEEDDGTELITFEDALTIIAPALYNQMTVKLAMQQMQSAAQSPAAHQPTSGRRAAHIK